MFTFCNFSITFNIFGMSAIFMSALLLELVSLLLRHRVGRGWWCRPGSIIVLASVIYNGVSPVLLAFPSIRALDTYRIGIEQSYVDEATLIMAAGMLAFTLAYLATHPERIAPKADREDMRQAMRVLDWRVFACALVPLAVLTYKGKGFNNAGPVIGAGASLTTSLSATFFVVLMVLTAFSVLLRFGTRWFFPVLVAQSLLLASAGERTPIFVDAVALLVLMTRTGNRPSVNQVRLLWRWPWWGCSRSSVSAPRRDAACTPQTPAWERAWSRSGAASRVSTAIALSVRRP